MALVKVRGWQLLLINLIVIPVLIRVVDTVEKNAKETPGEWDDILAGAFRAVIEFLRSPEAFEET